MPHLSTRIKDLQRNGDVSRAFTVQMLPPPKDKLDTSHKEYRYELKAPPRQMDDEVVKIIIKAIQYLNKKRMMFAAANFWPHNMDETRPLWPGRAKSARKLYAFTQTFVEFPLAAEVTLLRGTIELTPDKILVRNKRPGKDEDKQPWTPLIHWLLKLPIPHNLLTQGFNKRGVPRILHCQQIWWSKNGQCFPFLRLPAELRALVYKHALGEIIHPETHYNMALGVRQLSLGPRQDRASAYHHGSRFASAQGELNYNILALNKATRADALKAGWEGTWKHFKAPGDLLDVLDPTIVSSAYVWLSRVHLSWTLTEYLSFFGVSIHPAISIDASRSKGHVLQGISGLRYLEMSFRSPYGAASSDNPWSYFYTHNRQNAWFYNNTNYRNMAMAPCQKIIVDWIMTFAFPYIKTIPNVRLAGAVKRTTKEKWYYILEREYRERKYDFRTHGYHHPQELASILGRPIHA